MLHADGASMTPTEAYREAAKRACRWCREDQPGFQDTAPPHRRWHEFPANELRTCTAPSRLEFFESEWERFHNIELVAAIMCRLEHSVQHKTLEEYYETVARVWRRHIPEAEKLIAEIDRVWDQTQKEARRG